MTFTIPGEPVGKGRPRVDRGRAHTPAKTKAYEEKVAWCYKQAHGRLHEGPLRMVVTASTKYRKARHGEPERP